MANMPSAIKPKKKILVTSRSPKPTKINQNKPLMKNRPILMAKTPNKIMRINNVIIVLLPLILGIKMLSPVVSINLSHSR